MRKIWVTKIGLLKFELNIENNHHYVYLVHVQKYHADLAVVTAWRRMCSRKNSALNLTPPNSVINLKSIFVLAKSLASFCASYKF